MELFGITEGESTALGFHQLVSDRLRQVADRRAEGIPTKAQAQAARPRPAHEQAGKAKTTYYRQRDRASKLAATLAAAEALTNDRADAGLLETLSTATPDSEPGPPAGVAKGGSAPSPPISNILEGVRVAGSPTPVRPQRVRLSEPGQPANPKGLPDSPAGTTAEARRYAVLARRLGCVWAEDWQPGQPLTWFDPPADLVDSDLAGLLDAAHAAAIAAERQVSIPIARERAATAQELAVLESLSLPERRKHLAAARAVRAAERAASAKRDVEQAAARARGDRPPGVSAHVWDLVPSALRPRVDRRAAQIFVRLDCPGPDDAVIRALRDVAQWARDDEAVIAEALAAAPEADEATVRRWLYLGEIRSAADVVAHFESERRQREATMRATAAADAAGVSPADRAAVIARAARLLISRPDADAGQAIRDALADWRHRQRHRSGADL